MRRGLERLMIDFASKGAGPDETDGPGEGDDGSRRRREPGGRSSRTKLVAVSVVVLVGLVGAGLGAYWLFGEADPEDLRTFDFDSDVADGLSSDGVTWEAVTGRFSSVDGAAEVAVFNDEGPRTVTVTDIGATNAKIDVTARHLTAGWGAVFRYVGPFNYWYVSAVPDFAVFNVIRVVGGRAEVVGRTQVVEMRDGMTLTIDLQGPQIKVFDGARSIFGFDDDHALGATRIGLLANANAEDASWDEIVASVRPGGPPKVIVRSRASDAGAGSTTTTTPATDDPVDPAAGDGTGFGDGEPASP